jgi:hypothetical protein
MLKFFNKTLYDAQFFATIEFISTYLRRLFDFILPLTIILFVYYNIERTESLKLRDPTEAEVAAT